MNHSHDGHWGRPYRPEFPESNEGRPRKRRRRGFGPPPGFGPPGFGPPGFGPHRGRGKGRQRGDVRVAILVLLAEQPRHGYDLIRAIEERTDGAWSPSPGSIYPTLQALVDEGLITMADVDGRNVASVTEAGRAWLGDRSDETAAVFERHAGGESVRSLMDELRSLAEVATLIARRHDADTAKATAVLATARKDLYRLLSDDTD